jgi:hypothetical protein
LGLEYSTDREIFISSSISQIIKIVFPFPFEVVFNF